MKPVLVLNGPNLNLLGVRRPDVYGTTGLGELEELCRGWGAVLGLAVVCHQSNHEGGLVDRLHAARTTCAGVVFNPGAYSHYAWVLHDAVEAIALPVVEVHISEPKARPETWRHMSVIEPACLASITGKGIDGYRLALETLAAHLGRKP